MSSSKKKRDDAKKRLRRKLQLRRQQRERSDRPVASFVRPDIHREVRYITECAQAEDARIVAFGNLVLFSTSTRDAWLLDSEDSFALCLCRDGEPQPFRIFDTSDKFAIEWTADFAIEGEVFVVYERSGRVVAIHGYPTAAIAAACDM